MKEDSRLWLGCLLLQVMSCSDKQLQCCSDVQLLPMCTDMHMHNTSFFCSVLLQVVMRRQQTVREE